jgi:nucleotide-binding universal stress UspA family protein
MVFLVPYDGSRVSEAALDRAVEHGEALEEEVVAVTFVPTGSEYAERRKWIEPTADFAVDSARSELKRKIAETTDDAERNYLDSGATSVENGVSDRIRRIADDIDASILYVGTSDEESEDAVTTPFGSIAQDASYDVHLVRSH